MLLDTEAKQVLEVDHGNWLRAGDGSGHTTASRKLFLNLIQ
jgi:hypothetical protein